MTAARGIAPGGPGVAPRWTSSAKSGVGTAADARSTVWFTLSHGILNEVYYPRIDQANVRDMELIVTAASGFFAEEKRDTDTEIRMIESGAPGFVIANTCRRGRFRIEKTVLTDPDRDVLLQRTNFVPLQGTMDDYRLFVLLAPHIGNQGECNTAWIGDYKGAPMLFAERDGTALALGCSNGFSEMSCGFVGVNDGWQQLKHHGRLTECYACAELGNVALTAELDLSQSKDGFVLALGFGSDADEAGHAVRASLLGSFKDVQQRFVTGWKEIHRQSSVPGAKASIAAEYRASATVLRVHEDKVRRGAFIASLSVPWGNSRGDHDLGGYHVVWPRDLVEIAGGLLAAGHTDAARQAFHYLMTTQEADGHWPQNMWLDGRQYWSGDQLDETAFPILLADQLRRRRALRELDAWPTVRRAASYVARTGPVTKEDRWEEDGGYSTFTLAVVIAALLAAADFADAADDDLAAKYLRDTADVWYDALDRWTYVTDTDLAKENGVDGYYVRIAPPNESAGGRLIPVRNHDDDSTIRYTTMVSPDALALVRFGLRKANDPRMLNTIRVVDRLLCTETRNGPVWHRYNDDGYGEHADGAPFDGTGIGRGWPLLTGERGHYELAAGHVDRAQELLDVMRKQTGLGGLLPEQLWDADDIPERALFNGCPTGSAMPLAWAHAERVKLQRSLSDGTVFDMPPQTLKRYAKAKRRPRDVALWRFNNKIRTMSAGSALRIDVLSPAVVHWTTDDWRTARDVNANDTSLGVWTIELPTGSVPVDGVVRFTFYWSEASRWEGQDFAVSTRAPG